MFMTEQGLRTAKTMGRRDATEAYMGTGFLVGESGDSGKEC